LALPLPEPRKQLRRYYAGDMMPSPQGGGLLEIVRIQPGKGTREGGRVIFECLTSTLRYELRIPAASKEEKDAVRAMQDAGQDPTCPRHGESVRLLRVGPNMSCTQCGVAYGRTAI